MDAIPDGSTLLDDDGSGLLSVQGPNGSTHQVAASTLSDADRTKLGMDKPAVDVTDADQSPDWMRAHGLGLVEAAGLGLKDATLGPPDDRSYNQSMAAAQHPDMYGLGASLSPSDQLSNLLGFGGQIGQGIRNKVGGMFAPEGGSPTLSPAAPPQPAAAPQPQPSPAPPQVPPNSVQLPPPGQGGGGMYTGAGDLAQVRASQKQGDQAIQDQATAEIAKNHDLASRQADAYQQQLNNIRAYQAKQEAFQQESAKREADLSKMAGDVFNTKIDPEHWWNTRDTGQKVAATLSMMLGSFGEAFTGKNGSPINEMINRDVQAQRENFEAKKSGYTAKQNLYTQFRQRGASDLEATLLSQKQLLDLTNQKLQDFAQMSSDPQVHAKAAALKSQNDQAIAEKSIQLKGQIAQTAHANVEFQWAKEAHDRQLQYMQATGIDPTKRPLAIFVDDPRSPGGKRVEYAPDDKTAPDYRIMYGSAKALSDGVDNAIALAKGWGTSSDLTPTGSAYTMQMMRLADLINPATGVKFQMPVPDREELYKAIRASAGRPSAANIAALRQLKSGVLKDTNGQFETAGMGKPFAEDPASLQKNNVLGATR